jgi:hypothetical protein
MMRTPSFCQNKPHNRPKKNAPVGSKGAALRQHIDATLGSGNLREAVLLPPGEVGGLYKLDPSLC